MQLEWAKQKSEQANALLNQALQQASNPSLIAQAITIYQEVIQSEAELAEPYLGIAWLAFSAGQYDQAQSLLQTALAIEPGNLDVMRLQQRFESLKHRQIEIEAPLETAVDSLRSHLPTSALPAVYKAAAPTNQTAHAQAIPNTEAAPEPRPTQITKILGPAQSGMTHLGPQVLLLQQWLKALGHVQVQETGTYDQATLNAVQAFQMKRKLKISGLIDKTSAQLLNQLAQGSKKTSSPPANLSVKAEAVSKNETRLVLDLGADPKKQTSSGPQVLILQTALLNLGYALATSAQYDKATAMAVRAFQSQHKLPLNGVVDAACRKVINQAIERQTAQDSFIQAILDALDAQPDLHVAISSDSSAHMAAFLKRWCNPDTPSFSGPAPLAETEGPYSEITEMLGTPGQSGVISQGESVLRCQEILIEKGYPVKANAQFDLQTFTELKRFQGDHLLDPTGYVDQPTRDLLNQSLKQQIAKHLLHKQVSGLLRQFAESQNLKRDSALAAEQVLKLAAGEDFAEVLKQAIGINEILSDLGPAGRANLLSTGPEVELLQIWLQSESPLPISGKYDPETFKIVRQFQLKHKISMTGTVDAKTRQLLNAHFCEKTDSVRDPDPFDSV